MATICCCHGDVHTFTFTPGIHRGWSLPTIPTDTLSFFPLQDKKNTDNSTFYARAVLLKCLEILSLPGAQSFLCLHLCLPPSFFSSPSFSPSYMHTFSIFFLLNYTQTVSRPFIPETVPPWLHFSHISSQTGHRGQWLTGTRPREAGSFSKQPITDQIPVAREAMTDRSCRTEVSRVIVIWLSISVPLFPRLSILLLRSAPPTSPPRPPILAGRSHWLPSASLKNDFVMRLVES